MEYSIYCFLLTSGQQNQLSLTVNNAPGGGSSGTSRSVNPHPAALAAVPAIAYKYTLKIFNAVSPPERPVKFIVRQLHNFQARLRSLDELKTRVFTMFNTDVHAVSEISVVGYFEGKQKR